MLLLSTQPRNAGLQEDGVIAVAAAAAVVAATATARTDADGVEGCGGQPEAKSEAPR